MLLNRHVRICQKPINITIYCQNGYNSATSIDFTKMCYLMKSGIVVRLWTIRLVASTFLNRTIPSPCTTFLAPLSKGELLLLSFAQPTIEGLSHPPHHHFQNRTIPPTFRNANVCMHFLVLHLNYPLLCTNTLASLVKGEVLSPEKIRATTGEIATPPPFPKPHYSFALHHILGSLE